jgi:hypothetical protein
MGTQILYFWSLLSTYFGFLKNDAQTFNTLLLLFLGWFFRNLDFYMKNLMKTINRSFGDFKVYFLMCFHINRNANVFAIIQKLWCFQSTKFPMLSIRISNLKLQTVDLIRWTWSYWNIFGYQILHFFEFFCYFLDGWEITSIGWCINH